MSVSCAAASLSAPSLVFFSFCPSFLEESFFAAYSWHSDGLWVLQRPSHLPLVSLEHQYHLVPFHVRNLCILSAFGFSLFLSHAGFSGFVGAPCLSLLDFFAEPYFLLSNFVPFDGARFFSDCTSACRASTSFWCCVGCFHSSLVTCFL